MNLRLSPVQIPRGICFWRWGLLTKFRHTWRLRFLCRARKNVEKFPEIIFVHLRKSGAPKCCAVTIKVQRFVPTLFRNTFYLRTNNQIPQSFLWHFTFAPNVQNKFSTHKSKTTWIFPPIQSYKTKNTNEETIKAITLHFYNHTRLINTPIQNSKLWQVHKGPTGSCSIRENFENGQFAPNRLFEYFSHVHCGDLADWVSSIKVDRRSSSRDSICALFLLFPFRHYILYSNVLLCRIVMCFVHVLCGSRTCSPKTTM